MLDTRNPPTALLSILLLFSFAIAGTITVLQLEDHGEGSDGLHSERQQPSTMLRRSLLESTGGDYDPRLITSLVDPKSVEAKGAKDLPRRGTGNVVRAVSTSRSPRKIFCCGMWDRSVKAMFPKWEGEYIYLKRGQNVNIQDLIDEYGVTSDDLFFAHLHAADCCVSGGVYNFPGKKLYFNPEPMDEWQCTPRPPNEPFSAAVAEQRKHSYLPQDENALILGPHEDSENSIQVFAGVQYIVHTGKSHDLSKIIHPAARRKNTKKHFMAYVQSHYVKEREEAVVNISKFFSEAPYGEDYRIHMGGKCQGSTSHASGATCSPVMGKQAERIETLDEAASITALLDMGHFLQDYRFAIAFENEKVDGYVSEKIINVFISGAIPIYWGTKDVFKLFNENAFIFYDENNPQAALDQIATLEANPDEYEKMLREPILANGMETVQRHLSLSDDIGGGYLRKQILKKLGYELDVN